MIETYCWFCGDWCDGNVYVLSIQGIGYNAHTRCAGDYVRKRGAAAGALRVPEEVRTAPSPFELYRGIYPGG